ncbi:tol-pal system-associated acyl-CoA thioesterase [Glaciecola sp. 2405UD65-10]|uniref:tol-pal system-associated acyl-CoA thioesterase n=1 Tax=Glaciecola sp. 2405UD65-10 TaxID=3397244 RepID=UPI003B5B1EF0
MNKYNINLRVYYEDTDAGGIVYHANYLKFMERARTEWVRSLGVNQHNLLEQSLGFVVIDMNIRFQHSAKLDDMLSVSCEVITIKRASLVFEQSILHEGKVLVRATVKVACVNTSTNKPIAIPSTILKEMRSGH